jgi:hypothetical protein
MNAQAMRFGVALVALSLVAATLASPRAGAAATLRAAQKSAICAARATCSIGKIYDAGKSPPGAPLAVAEVHLGLEDRPDDAPDSGCHADDKFDGGVEYWLAEGAQPPKRVLKFCNDGYGAAGVGEDDVRSTRASWSISGSAAPRIDGSQRRNTRCRRGARLPSATVASTTCRRTTER